MNTVFLFHKRSKNRNVIDTKATPMEMSQQNFIVSIERPMLATLFKPRICKPFARLRSHKSIYKAKIFQGAKGIPQDRTRANNKWVSRSVKSVFRFLEQQQILYCTIWFGWLNTLKLVCAWLWLMAIWSGRNANFDAYERIADYIICAKMKYLLLIFIIPCANRYFTVFWISRTEKRKKLTT